MTSEWTKEMLDKAYAFNRKAKAALELEALLFGNALNDYFHPESIMGTYGKCIISGYENPDYEAKSKIRALYKLIPDLRKAPNHIDMWSPYDDTVIIQHLFYSKTYEDIPIAVWIKTDIQHIPSEYQSDKCKFVPVEEKKYSLVCEAQS